MSCLISDHPDKGVRAPEAPWPQEALVARIRSRNDAATLLSAGNQGSVHLFECDARRFVVKIPHGRGLAGWLRKRMIRHEFRVYRRLEGLTGIPPCFGLLEDQYLVLGHVEGPDARLATQDGRLVDTERFYDRMRVVLEGMHARGVSHADLKKRDNILVTAGDQPCLIDFGMAVLKRPGFHPWNRFMFAVGCRLDFNAWIKHKYGRDYSRIRAADRPLYRPMLFERIWRPVRRVLRNAIRRIRAR